MTDLFGDPITEDPADEKTHAEQDQAGTRQSDHGVIGHDAVLAQCTQMLQQGQFPHAFALQGTEGIGKHLLALHIAAMLMGHEKLDRMIQGGHPDLLCLGREVNEKTGRMQRDLPIDTIRRIAGFIRHTAAEGGWRVVIIDDADTMTVNAQNALLKVLEEPPKKTCLILVLAQLGRILPTIRSRIRCIPVSTLSPSEITVIMRDKIGMSPTPLALTLSGGSVARAIELSDPQISEDVTALIRMLPMVRNLNPMQREDMIQTVAAGGEPVIPLRILQRVMEADMLNQMDHAALPADTACALADWKQAVPLASRLKMRDKLVETIAVMEAAHLDRLAFSEMVIHNFEQKSA